MAIPLLRPRRLRSLSPRLGLLRRSAGHAFTERRWYRPSSGLDRRRSGYFGLQSFTVQSGSVGNRVKRLE